MPRVVLVHGYNVRDKGRRSIDKLAPYLERKGWEVDTDSADYGWWGLFKIYFKDKKKVEDRLIRAFKNADMILTHSNGAAFATRALNRMDRDARCRTIQHFSPALDRDWSIPIEEFKQSMIEKIEMYVTALITEDSIAWHIEGEDRTVQAKIELGWWGEFDSE